jgi:O-methyltransferase
MNSPVGPTPHATASNASDLYIDLIKNCLTRTAFPEPLLEVRYVRGTWSWYLAKPFKKLLSLKNYVLCVPYSKSVEQRETGADWPPDAETMIGMRRLNNVEQCVRSVIENGISGDLIETGVWRGGTCIFMRSLLAAYGDESRSVWVADSFQGLPEATRPEDRGMTLKHQFSQFDQLAVSLDQVRANFARYGLLDSRVRFLKGWFKDTLSGAPIDKLAVMRLDGDLYESTMDALVPLYPKLSVGGYCIIDDYGGIPACAQAVNDYRKMHDITDPIEVVDATGVYWKKTRA